MAVYGGEKSRRPDLNKQPAGIHSQKSSNPNLQPAALPLSYDGDAGSDAGFPVSGSQFRAPVLHIDLRKSLKICFPPSHDLMLAAH
jgi:hypothetical protein